MNTPIQSGNQESRKGGATASRLAAFFVLFVLIVVNLPAAQTNWNSKAKAHANPAIARAIERRTMAPARPRVAFQRIEHGTVISVLQDGTVVSAPLKKAVTARIPEALGRVRIDRALSRISAAVDGEGADNAKRAKSLEKLADKMEKENAKGSGKAKAAGAALLAAGAAAGYLAGRKARPA